jgi:hypothetical protein
MKFDFEDVFVLVGSFAIFVLLLGHSPEQAAAKAVVWAVNRYIGRTSL